MINSLSVYNAMFYAHNTYKCLKSEIVNTILPAQLRGHQVAVRTESAGVAVHLAHQFLFAWFLGHGQFIEYLVQFLYDRRVHWVVRRHLLRRGRWSDQGLKSYASVVAFSS